jgi:hypothetical protein
MKETSMLNARGYGLTILSVAFLTLSACQNSDIISEKSPITNVEVRTVEVPRPAPIVPVIDEIEMRKVTWHVLTEETFEEKIEMLRRSGQPIVFFALTQNGYESLSLNLSDIRKMVEQQKIVIRTYQRSYR